MLSSRLPRDLSPNRVSQVVAARRAAGLPIIDLTASNPTAAGFAYPDDLLTPLADAAALRYEPQALGLPAAREAVAGEYARHGLAIDPAHVALTASTSEAYALLFKLFCDPGDQVLVPRPSYPLFEHLSSLEAVEAVPYRLEYHGSWRIDIESVRHAVTPRTRALVVVSPNNPTGSWLHHDDLAALTGVCATNGLALIGDEVFADYPLDPAPGRTSVLAQARVLTCALGGLSKSAGLPQVKLGWMAWAGPEAAVARALHAYGSWPTATCRCPPRSRWPPGPPGAGGVVRAQVQARIRQNPRRCAREPGLALDDRPARRRRMDGGCPRAGAAAGGAGRVPG